MAVNALRWAGGFAVLALVASAAAALSDWPRYRLIPPDTGVLTLSVTHSGDRSAACRQLSEEELAKLPPNMRRSEVCERRRPPVTVELAVDGAILYRATVAPSGIAGDGSSHLHERFALPAGEHALSVRLSDRADGAFNYETSRIVDLAPEQNLAIDFVPAAGGFVFR